MLGIVARLIYYLQFWMPKEKRHPVALICDEAHIYLPRGGGNPTEERRSPLSRRSQGRPEVRVSIVVVSQRPSDVNATILSQCNNVVSLRLTNSADQDVVKRLMPEASALCWRCCLSWTLARRWSSAMPCCCEPNPSNPADGKASERDDCILDGME